MKVFLIPKKNFVVLFCHIVYQNTFGKQKLNFSRRAEKSKFHIKSRVSLKYIMNDYSYNHSQNICDQLQFSCEYENRI